MSDAQSPQTSDMDKRPRRDEDAPFIAELFSRELPEPMSVERIR